MILTELKFWNPSGLKEKKMIFPRRNIYDDDNALCSVLFWLAFVVDGDYD